MTLILSANQRTSVFTFTGEPQRLNKDIDVEDVEKQKQFMKSRCLHKNTTKKSRRSKKGIHKNQDPSSDVDESKEENTGNMNEYHHDHSIPEHKVTFGFQHRNHKRQKSRVRHTKSNKKNNSCDDV